jgi:hypothetical protein
MVMSGVDRLGRFGTGQKMSENTKCSMEYASRYLAGLCDSWKGNFGCDSFRVLQYNRGPDLSLVARLSLMQASPFTYLRYLT